MSDPPTRPEPGRAAAFVIGAGLLAAHFILAFTASQTKSLTFDEIAHLPAGITYWQERDDRLNPEHPILPKLIAGFPALFIPFKLDPADPDWAAAGAWRDAMARLEGEELRRVVFETKLRQWSLGGRFLFRENAETFRRFLPWSRACTVMVSVALGALIGLWTAWIWGRMAGLVAMALWAFCPSLLGHAPLATTDVSHALGVTATLAALHWLLDSATPHRSTERIAALACAIALLMLTKFSGVLLAPVAVLAVLVRAWREPVGGRAAHAVRALAGLVVSGVIAGIVIAIFYLLVFGRVSYPTGFMLVARRLAYTPGAQVYLMGEVRPHFYSYFLVCGLVKFTIPMLALSVGGLAVLPRGIRGMDFPACLLIVHLAWFSLMLLFLFDNIGVRYMFPILPALFMLGGGMFSRMWVMPRGRIAAAALLVWHGLVPVLQWPNYIQYMNEISLVKGRGYFLSDSNLDWGQDLPAVRRYMERNSIPEALVLSLYEESDLGFYGINGRYIREEELLSAPAGSVAVISIFSLHDLREDRDPLLRDWRPEAVLNDTMHVFRKID